MALIATLPPVHRDEDETWVAVIMSCPVVAVTCPVNTTPNTMPDVAFELTNTKSPEAGCPPLPSVYEPAVELDKVLVATPAAPRLAKVIVLLEYREIVAPGALTLPISASKLSSVV